MFSSFACYDKIVSREQETVHRLEGIDMKAAQEMPETYIEPLKQSKKSAHHLARSFRKFKPEQFSRRVTGAGWWMRSLTAAVMMIMAVLAPIHVLPTYAAPVDPEENVSPIVTVASAADLRQLRGDKKLTRKEKSRLLALALRRKAALAEPEVTADMRTLERSSAKLQGLDYRLKSTDSLARKITSDADEDQVSLAAAAAGISDVLRYTLTCSDADYSTMVPQAMAALTEKGYRVEKFRNAWGGKFYQGVNVHLMSPAGVRVELQFHTPQSFAVKQASHAVYEIRRNPASSAEEVEEATRLSIAYNAAVVVPEGARAIHWPVAA